MAATGTPTPNIGLRIPLGTDPASVDDINYNSNLIDTKLGAVGSDSVQDQLDTLNSKIAKNSYGTEVDISSYTSSNYECPEDGYAVIVDATGNTGYVQIRPASGSDYVTLGGYEGRHCCYVRTGMKLRVSGVFQVAKFVPFA